MKLGILDMLAILFITIGPTKAMILYASLTEGEDAESKRRIAIRAVTVAAVVLVIFSLLGEAILHTFHITLPALKLAGGLILLRFALHMVASEEPEPDEHAPHRKVSPRVAIYPLAMPLMATPQGIVAIVVLSAARPGMGASILLTVLVLLILGFNLLCLLYSERVLSAIGPSGLQVITRIVGLLLTALAIQMMISGFQDLGLIARPVFSGRP